ncbi:hypothetical protein ACF3NA_03475 [Alkanindiges sp. WGS2144]|uniref:hypothetical protein n=1 Tax=Alkanindiges sp. WGS2144 TaxID=3366808 RepID=UPI003751303C
MKLFKLAQTELKAKFQKVEKFTVQDLKVMYSIYEKYYENTSFNIFQQDFYRKTGAFIIYDPETSRIVGFSTLLSCNIKTSKKTYHALFSGDTVIEKEFWGSRALQRAMYLYLLAEKFRHPTEPVYWMLISKGFKTYLLLANNFFTYYPHFEGEHQYLSEIVDSYCRQYFADYYNPAHKILDFGSDYQPLKQSVAPITEHMRVTNPKIKFFEQCNPNWVQGTELPCIGEITWQDIAKYAQRFISKPISQGKLEALIVNEAQPV